MFTIKVRGDYIQGKFKRARRSPRKIISIDPGDSGYRIGAFPVEPSHVDKAVTAAREASHAWARSELADREGCLRKFAAQVVNRREQLVKVLCAEMGKARWVAEREVEASGARIENELKEGPGILSTPKVGGLGHAVEGQANHRPLGVMALLGPASSPLAQACHALAPALLSGNTIVFKPSKLSPACGQLVAEMIDEADFPRGVFNLVQGDAALGLELVAREEVDGVWFVGSLEAGRRVLKAAADPLRKMVALHLSGLNAALVLDDADLDRSVYQCALGSFIESGQSMGATSLVLVDQKVFETFANAFVDAVAAMKVGYGLDPGVFMGPVFSEMALERNLDRQSRLKAAGARELLAAERLKRERPGFYLSPAVMTAKPEQVPALLDEGISFGPDVLLVPFSTDRQALDMVNGCRRPLVASVMTDDDAHFEQVADELNYGHIHQNLATCDRSMHLPSQGRGDCGNHRPGGLWAQRTCSVPMSVLRCREAYDPARQVKAFPGRFLIRE